MFLSRCWVRGGADGIVADCGWPGRDPVMTWRRKAMPSDRAMIAATGLRKSYGGKLVPGGIDLILTEATTFALLGPNGAGKTTGRATYHRIRGALEQITARLFDFPAEDLATAGRVLGIVTACASAVLAGQGDAP